MKRMGLMAGAVWAAAMLAGCAVNPLDWMAGQASEPRAVVTPETNVVTTPMIATNAVEVTRVTDGRWGKLTNVVTELQVVTNLVTETRVVMVTNVVYVRRSGIEQTLAAGQALSPLAGPWAPAAAAGLAALSAFQGYLVRRKNGEKRSVEDQLTAVVTGVEKVAGTLPDERGAEVKQTIAKAAEAMGVAKELYRTVKKVTG